MKIEGQFEFGAPRDEVWQALLDPEVLAQVMPGCEKLELVAENSYEGALKIKVGPVQGKFKGKIDLSDIDAPNGYILDVNGRGAPGFVKAKAIVELEPQGEGTLMKYSSDAQVGGKVASVGQRLLDSSAKAIIKQSLEGLDQILKARLEPEPEPVAEPSSATPSSADSEASTTSESPPQARQVEYEPPSQAEFAARVAKEVIEDLVPRQVLIGAAVLAVVGFFMLCCRGNRCGIQKPAGRRST